MNMAHARAALVFSLALVACSSGPVNGGGGGGSTSTGGGSASTGGGSAGTGGGGTTCTPLSNTCGMVVPAGPTVTPMYVTGTAPTPTGGTVVLGTYDLTSSTVYVTDGGSGPTGAEPKKETFVFTTNTVNQAQLRSVPDGGCEIDRQTGSLVFASPMVTYTQVCPTCSGGNCGGMASYSAGSTTFTLFNSDNGVARVDVYTKQ